MRTRRDLMYLVYRYWYNTAAAVSDRFILMIFYRLLLCELNVSIDCVDNFFATQPDTSKYSSINRTPD